MLEIFIVTRPTDISAYNVAKWLNGKCRTHLISRLDLSYKSKEISIELDSNGLSDSTSKVVWFRKFPSLEMGDHLENESLEKFLKAEYIELIKSYYYYAVFVDGIDTLGCSKIFFGDPNKIMSLCLAKESGLKIPNTFVSNSSDFLRAKTESSSSLICKPIGNVSFFLSKNNKYSLSTYTKKIPNSNIAFNDCPNLLQCYIEKSFELRCIYINGKIFASAHFTKNMNIELVDSRTASSDFEVRICPFKLPDSIKCSINDFMGKMELDTGCIDMVVDANKNYYFLEVNPVGEYQLESLYCNFNLDKYISNVLLDKLKS